MADPNQAESSKKGRKRAERVRKAIHAAMNIDPSTGVNILDEQDDYLTPNIISRRTRRRTRLAVRENFDIVEEQEDHNNSTMEPVEEQEDHNNSTTEPVEEQEDHNNCTTEPSLEESETSSDATDDESLPNTYPTGSMLNVSTKGSVKRCGKRGPAKCIIDATENDQRMEIIFNERGQPINEESVKMASLLGTLVRKKVDITINDWRRVPKETKEKLWETVKQKFILQEKSKDYIMMEMGYLWRTSKSRLNAIIDSYDNEADRIAAKPDIIDPEQWKIFVRQRASKEYQEKRKKFKEIRARQNLPHTLSRKGYARMEAEMKKQSSNPSSISRIDVWERAHTKKNGQPVNKEVAEKMKKMQEFKDSSPNPYSSSIKDDALSHLFGFERRSRVRGIGFGVTPSKLGLASPSNGKVVQLEKEVNKLTEKVCSMETLQKEMQEQMKAMQNLVTQLLQNQAQSGKPEGVKCKLFRMVKEDIVAEGRWVTDEPNTVVHDIPLGQGASKVWVDCAVEPTARLWRPTIDMERMKDAVGTTIAWPTDFIIKEEDI